MCKGYKLIFIWNTGNASSKYGLYQLSSSSCPSDFKQAHLLVTPASSPSKSGSYNYTVPSTGKVSDIPVYRLLICCLADYTTLLPLLSMLQCCCGWCFSGMRSCCGTCLMNELSCWFWIPIHFVLQLYFADPTYCNKGELQSASAV